MHLDFVAHFIDGLFTAPGHMLEETEQKQVAQGEEETIE